MNHNGLQIKIICIQYSMLSRLSSKRLTLCQTQRGLDKDDFYFSQIYFKKLVIIKFESIKFF